MALIVVIALGPLIILSVASRAATKVVAPVCGAILLSSLYGFVVGPMFEWAAAMMARMPTSH